MKSGRWTIAILLSAVLHAGAAIWLGPNRDEVQIAGSSPMEIALAGNAFQDAVAAGEASADVTEPVDTADTATPPVEAKTTEARETIEAADTANEIRRRRRSKPFRSTPPWLPARVRSRRKPPRLH